MVLMVDALTRGAVVRWAAAAAVLLTIASGAAGVLAMPQRDEGVVRFVYPDSSAQQVFLAGDFNGWSQTATPLDREGSGFTTRVFLDPGTYEYKFLVDGGWRTDAGNPETTARGNSVVRVGADAEVLPARPAPAAAATPAGTQPAAGELGWAMRYLGYVTARYDDALGRYDLDHPLHAVDLAFDARLTPELSTYFLGKLTNGGAGEPAGQLALRYDRGQIEWTPGVSRLRLFDNVGVGQFDDPGALVGRIGIYADEFGYARRGLTWRQRVFGAPLDVFYADDTESGANVPPVLGLVGSKPGPHPPGTPELYRTSDSQRGADVLAVRARGGTDDLGFGAGLRLDRGRNRGQALFVERDSVAATGLAYETAERWFGWGVDLRARYGRLRLAAEYLEGSARAEAQRVQDVAWGDSTASFSAPGASDANFALDRSRRGVVVLRAVGVAGSTLAAPAWSARPGTGEASAPSIAYEYEEHDYSAVQTGTPFLTRRHTLGGVIYGRILQTDVGCEVEQSWFEYPAAAPWQNQFWFRRHNGWLDEDLVSLERTTLLGTHTAAVARVHLARLVWPQRNWRGELHATWAAPGFDHAPRYGEGILRLAFPLRDKLELRTHSRLAVYRQFTTADAGIVAVLGPGPHFEAGHLPFAGGAPVEHSYQALSAHFVELVYAVTSRSDIALGFGVDPEVVYTVTNEFAAIGWDEFLFANGVGPAATQAHPVSLGSALQQAEQALERERRLVLEARVRF
jgi:hypothetical protein